MCRLQGYVLVWLMLVSSLLPIASIELYEFCPGRDAIVTFHQPLISGRRLTYDLFRGTLQCSFYHNGYKKDSHCLKHGQRERFDIDKSLSREELNVTLNIRNVQAKDNGFYVLVVGEEDGNGLWHNDIKDAYVEVKSSPGRAHCNIVTSPYFNELQEVRCAARPASDGGGLLACFQENGKTPFLRQPRHSANTVHAVFWMDTGSSIQCCSYAANCDKHADDCHDFVHYFATPDSPSITTFPTRQTGVDDDNDKTLGDTTPRILPLPFNANLSSQMRSNASLVDKDGVILVSARVLNGSFMIVLKVFAVILTFVAILVALTIRYSWKHKIIDICYRKFYKWSKSTNHKSDIQKVTITVTVRGKEVDEEERNRVRAAIGPHDDPGR